MNAAAKREPRNRRLDPKVRKGLILDAAAQLIVSEGVSAVSIERVSRDAGVSKTLVYSYFDNRVGLLRDLLDREATLLREQQKEAALNASGLRDFGRRAVGFYLQYAESSVIIMDRLVDEPNVLTRTKGAGPTAIHLLRSDLVAILQGFDIDADVAKLIGEMGLGVIMAAGRIKYGSRIDPRIVEDAAMAFLDGGLDRLDKR